MININVSESFAFDFLSIYEVKFHKNPTSEIADKNYEECEDYISNQLGWDFYYEIVQSKEYNDLYESNKRLFELVELAKDDKVKASEVDRGVIDRWEKKKALQDKFFPDSQLNEQKFNKY